MKQGCFPFQNRREEACASLNRENPERTAVALGLHIDITLDFDHESKVRLSWNRMNVDSRLNLCKKWFL